MTTSDPFRLPGDAAPRGEKLQKFLSAAGVASRRHAEVLIQQGRVTINGDVARLGARVDEDDRVCVNGVEVGPQAPRLFLVNKPTKCVTTLDDPQGRRTVASLVPDDVRVYPVGRLDYDTSGLLIMTNDGELAHRLMHPSFGVEKTYQALVEGRVAPRDVRRLAEGVDIGEPDGMTAPAKARVIDQHDSRTMLELVIHEGRNRQVRRMCDAIGHPVIELVRVRYGPISLGDVRVGTSRPFTEQETRRIRKAAGLAPPRRAGDDSDRPSRAQRRAAQRAALEVDASSVDEAVDADRARDAKRRGKPDHERPASSGGGRGARPSGAKGRGRSGDAGSSARGPRGGRGNGRSDGGTPGGADR